MNIGIISKESHAKSHRKALAAQGHQVHMMGGNPGSVPPSLDILICRPASCSHGGYAKAMTHRRNGSIEVIIANGITEIMRSLKAISGGQKAPLTEALLKVSSSMEILEVLPRLLGVYSPLLHQEKAGPVVQILAARNGDDGLLGFQLWKKALKSVRLQSFRQYAHSEMRRLPQEDQRWVYTYPLRGGARSLAVFVENEDALSVVLSNMECASTKDEAQKRIKKTWEAIRPAAVDAVPPVPGPISEEPIVVEEPVAVEEPVVEEPVVEELPPEPEEVEAAKEASWHDGIQAAVSMLLSEMKAVGVKRLLILDDGTVEFKREVVVVQKTGGTMKVEAS